ncbi:hypothetical protein PR001_g29030 [Phytophthora rubi]|uniref:Uncharacterized protein n=1 Tax=Phytophthora rubi TaxID=129364 RepID=A0A6A3H6B2_9STRA|nr:hypothetical protein PR001_g29030 [Phytophthora rubi]
MLARSSLVSFAPVVSVGPAVSSACTTWSTSSSPAWGPSRTGRRCPSPPDCLVPCPCRSASSSPPTTSLAQVTRFRRTACSLADRRRLRRRHCFPPYRSSPPPYRSSPLPHQQPASVLPAVSSPAVAYQSPPIPKLWLVLWRERLPPR